MIRVGFWKWILLPCWVAGAFYGVQTWKGLPVPVFEATAILRSRQPEELNHHLSEFQTADVRRAASTALGWIKPDSEPKAVSFAADKLGRVLRWERLPGESRVRLIGRGKDAAGIAWVVNASAKTAADWIEEHRDVPGEKAPPIWSIEQLASAPAKPARYENWEFHAGAAAASLLFGFLAFSGKRRKPSAAPAESNLTPASVDAHEAAVKSAALALERMPEPKPRPAIDETEPATAQAPADPVQLEVLSPEPDSVPKDSAPAAVAPVQDPDSPASLYKQWTDLLDGWYAAGAKPLQASQLEMAERLIARSQAVACQDLDGLIRWTAQNIEQAPGTGAIVMDLFVGLAWWVSEGVPDEDGRALLWAAILRRLSPERWKALEAPLRQCVIAVIAAYGIRRGMVPAMTAEEEKAQLLGGRLHRHVRMGEVLRRRAVKVRQRAAA